MTISMCYIDDDTFANPDQSNINEVIKDIKSINFNIENKDNLQGYLGICVKYLKEGEIMHLTDQIIEQVGLTNSNGTEKTPAANHILH